MEASETAETAGGWRLRFGGDTGWAVDKLGDAWIVALRLTIQDGEPVIAEARIFPNDPNDSDYRADLPGVPAGIGQRAMTGEWTHDRSVVPRGGLTARLIRRVRTGDGLSATIREKLRHINDGFRPVGEDTPSLVGLAGGPGWDAVIRRIQQQPPVGVSRVQRLAMTAALYVTACQQDPGHANREVAQRLGIPVEHVRDRIYAARIAGLLTGGPGRGRAGGRLTPEGHEVLAALAPRNGEEAG